MSCNPLSANLRKWSNTLKQFFRCKPTNYLSVLDHFVGLVLKGFRKYQTGVNRTCQICLMARFVKIINSLYIYPPESVRKPKVTFMLAILSVIEDNCLAYAKTLDCRPFTVTIRKNILYKNSGIHISGTTMFGLVKLKRYVLSFQKTKFSAIILYNQGSHSPGKSWKVLEFE